MGRHGWTHSRGHSSLDLGKSVDWGEGTQTPPFLLKDKQDGGSLGQDQSPGERLKEEVKGQPGTPPVGHGYDLAKKTG